MRIYAHQKREDGSMIIDNPIIVDNTNIPDGLFLADTSKTYDEQGYEIDPSETHPQEPTESDRLEALEMLMVDILGGGF